MSIYWHACLRRSSPPRRRGVLAQVVQASARLLELRFGEEHMSLDCASFVSARESAAKEEKRTDGIVAHEGELAFGCSRSSCDDKEARADGRQQLDERCPA